MCLHAVQVLKRSIPFVSDTKTSVWSRSKMPWNPARIWQKVPDCLNPGILKGLQSSLIGSEMIPKRRFGLGCKLGRKDSKLNVNLIMVYFIAMPCFWKYEWKLDFVLYLSICSSPTYLSDNLPLAFDIFPSNGQLDNSKNDICVTTTRLYDTSTLKDPNKTELTEAEAKDLDTLQFFFYNNCNEKHRFICEIPQDLQ